MKLLRDFDEAVERRRNLQRRIGLIIAGFSAISVPMAFYYRVAYEGYSILAALSVLSVWAFALFIPIGLLTAWRIGRIGQAVQVVILYTTALLNSLDLVDYGDLSFLVFFGLAVTLCEWYGLIAKARHIIYSVAVMVIVVAVWYGIPDLEGATVAVFHWSVGVGAILACFAAILKAGAEEIRSRQTKLENEVTQRTVELKDALDNSEVLRKRNEVLLQELHHRTKNNLQLIASLISLQQDDHSRDGGSEKKMLDVIRGRVLAMASVHDLLHHSDRNASLSLNNFMRELTNGFIRAGQATELYLDTQDVGEVWVGLDFAIPFALIVNELVSNAAEHAYEAEGPNPIGVRVIRIESTLQLTIEDQGKGVPDSISLENPESTGLQIVTALVEQLLGTIKLDRTSHTRWIVQLPFSEAFGS